MVNLPFALPDTYFVYEPHFLCADLDTGPRYNLLDVYDGTGKNRVLSHDIGRYTNKHSKGQYDTMTKGRVNIESIVYW